MDLYQAIQARYSVRAYQDRPVEIDKLQRVLDAARLAPSARNMQDMKIVVARDPAVRRGLVAASGQEWMRQAPLILAVVSTHPERVMFCKVASGPVDCAIAIDHMTLAAVAEGLGSCWIGHFDQDRTREALGVPESAKIVELMALGYPADAPGRKKRKPLDELVCYDAFA